MSEAAAVGFSRLHSDERLTRRAVGGDERAFAAIFGRYHQSLYRFCLAIVGNPEDAQDALQNTMIKVMRALPGEERTIALKPWLYRIAHNESIDLLRRRRETRELDSEQAAPGYGLAEDVVTRERLRRLLVDLGELPERQRNVLVMREIAGLGFDEIGVALETTGAVARQTLYEARKSLRQMEDGREMDCDAVARALSEDDGRVIRRRDVRAHLRSCAGCREFRDDIGRRRQDFAALAPLSTVAAAGMLQGLIGGGSQAATGGGFAAAFGSGAAKTIATSAVVKGVATVAVVGAVGVTAADRAGVLHLGLPGDSAARPAGATPRPAGVKFHGGASDPPVKEGKAQTRSAEREPRSVGGSSHATPDTGVEQPIAEAPEKEGGVTHAGVQAPAPAAEQGSEGDPGIAKELEKPSPGANPPGQEKAAENEAETHEPSPDPEAGAPPEEPPPSTAATAPGASASPGKGAEKGKGLEKGKGHDKD